MWTSAKENDSSALPVIYQLNVFEYLVIYPYISKLYISVIPLYPLNPNYKHQKNAEKSQFIPIFVGLDQSLSIFWGCLKMAGEILRESNKTMEHFIFTVHLPIETSGGFHKWGYPQMDGLSWKIRTIKITDFGYTYFRKPPFSSGISNCHVWSLEAIIP